MSFNKDKKYRDVIRLPRMTHTQVYLVRYITADGIFPLVNIVVSIRNIFFLLLYGFSHVLLLNDT